MVTLAQEQSFLQSIWGQAQQASKQTGIPADFIAGQAALESGWGTSSLATNSNNIFGMGGPGNFQSYSSWSQSISAWVGLMNGGRYNTSSFGNMAPGQIAQSLSDQGYTSDSGYASGVSATVAQVDKLLGITPTTGSSDTSATGLTQAFGNILGGGSPATTTAGQASNPAGHTGILGPFEDWISSASQSLLWVFLGIVVLIVALFMLAKSAGVDVPSVVPIPV